MNIIYQSTRFAEDNIATTYARLYSNGEVKMFDVDMRHKTIREWWTTRDKLPNVELRLGEQVYVSGLTVQERNARARK